MNDWPADKIERRDVASLVPYARNARKHLAAQVAAIAASIWEWGWTVPVLVDKAGGIIAGHDRILAAQKLGITEVPVMVAKQLSMARASRSPRHKRLAWEQAPKRRLHDAVGEDDGGVGDIRSRAVGCLEIFQVDALM